MENKKDEFTWDLKPASKYRMSRHAKNVAFYFGITAIWVSNATLWSLTGQLLVGIPSAVSAALYGWITVRHIIDLDKEGQRDSERMVEMTKRADSLAYDIHRNAPHWPIEDIKHFVRARIYL